MYVHMYVCLCIYAYGDILLGTYIGRHTWVYVHIWMYVLYPYKYQCRETNIYVCTYRHILTKSKHTYICMYACMYVGSYVGVYEYVYTYTY